MLSEMLKTFRAGLSGRGERGQLARSAFGTMAVSLAGTAASFGVSVLLARALGTAGYGIYAFAMSVTLLLVVPASFGLPQPLIRDVASLHAAQKWGRLKGHLIRTDQITLVGSLAVAVVAGAVLWGWADVDPATRAALTWGLVLLPLLGLEQVHAAMLRGFRAVVRGQIPGSVIRPLVLGIVVALLVVVGVDVTAPAAIGIHAGAAAVAVLVATVWLWRTAPAPVGDAEADSTVRRVLLGATPFLGLQILAVVNSQVDILALGVLVPADEVGIYRVALAVSAFVSFFLSAAGLVIQPEVARHYSEGRLDHVQRLITGQARMAALATVPLVVLFVLAGSPFLRIVYGVEYLGAYVPLLILIGGQVVNVMTGPVGLVLNMTGHERETVRGLVLATAWAVVANLALIPILGLVGAAIAHASSLALWNVYLAVRVSKVVGITSTAWGRVGRR